MTEREWEAEGLRLFGPNKLKWKFICPSCKHVASVEDYRLAGAPADAIGISCIGRWTGHMETPMYSKKGPCNYTGYGLFQLNPVMVDFGDGQIPIFAFAGVEK